ncbi:hypothetical protein ACIBLB_14510, partial [Streptosporangium canum]|uniref:hypothetical protein n=1 Tax=Streptosporangium canum TaxID=324952 RepID=UPI003789C82F
MLVGLLCVALTEGTLSRHEMAGDQIGKVERERTQFLPDLLVEFLRRDVRSERGQFLTFPARSLVTAGRPVVSAVTGTGAFAFTAESTVAGTERPPATVVTVERRTPTTVIAVERGTLAALTRAVLATRLVTVAVGTTLTATGTVVTIERRTPTTIVTVERRTLTATGTVITVERGT